MEGGRKKRSCVQGEQGREERLGRSCDRGEGMEKMWERREKGRYTSNRRDGRGRKGGGRGMEGEEGGER